eukprot:1318727-Amorphochlora_amoeboformis.AAC.1
MNPNELRMESEWSLAHAVERQIIMRVACCRITIYSYRIIISLILCARLLQQIRVLDPSRMLAPSNATLCRLTRACSAPDDQSQCLHFAEVSHIAYRPDRLA